MTEIVPGLLYLGGFDEMVRWLVAEGSASSPSPRGSSPSEDRIPVGLSSSGFGSACNGSTSVASSSSALREKAVLSCITQLELDMKYPSHQSLFESNSEIFRQSCRCFSNPSEPPSSLRETTRHLYDQARVVPPTLHPDCTHRWLHLDVDDALSTHGLTYEKTLAAIRWLDAQLLDSIPKRQVFIHCQLGVSRSSTVACAYLLHLLLRHHCFPPVSSPVVLKHNKSTNTDLLSLSTASRGSVDSPSLKPLVLPREEEQLQQDTPARPNPVRRLDPPMQLLQTLRELILRAYGAPALSLAEPTCLTENFTPAAIDSQAIGAPTLVLNIWGYLVPFLPTAYQLFLEAAIRYLKLKRKGIAPNPSFLRFLIGWGKDASLMLVGSCVVKRNVATSVGSPELALASPRPSIVAPRSPTVLEVVSLKHDRSRGVPVATPREGESNPSVTGGETSSSALGSMTLLCEGSVASGSQDEAPLAGLLSIIPLPPSPTSSDQQNLGNVGMAQLTEGSPSVTPGRDFNPMIPTEGPLVELLATSMMEEHPLTVEDESFFERVSRVIYRERRMRTQFVAMGEEAENEAEDFDENAEDAVEVYWCPRVPAVGIDLYFELLPEAGKSDDETKRIGLEEPAVPDSGNGEEDTAMDALLTLPTGMTEDEWLEEALYPEGIDDDSEEGSS